ncbi:MAG TPA: GspE/PulE family protein [Candidatus Pacearchaeota archaeon]|nr:GspE/PulE family protein [Candidatus Pacearchaeota archaeon]HQI74810.1 GspE/PulE family protein [Candidatus Pacearchaeota archaeon]
MKIEDQQLKAFLLDSGFVSEKDFEKAQIKSQKAGKRLRDILISDKIIEEEKLIKLEAYILGIPFVDLEKEQIDPKILEIIPEATAKTHKIVAYKKRSKELEVAMLDPGNLEILDFLKKKSNLKILPRLTNSKSIGNVLKQYSKSLENEFADIVKSEESLEITEDHKENSKGAKDLEKEAKEIPVIKIVDTLVNHAILERASDIHIEPTEKEVVVRYRIDGLLKDAMILPKQVSNGIVARIKVLSNLKLDEHRLPQDGRFRVSSDSGKYSIRVSILPVFYGEKIVMRLLPDTVKSYDLESLGFRKEMAQTITAGLKKPLGMFLVTGPTGSGKTTTLYAMMEMLNKPEVNISTVEDPVEYQMLRINQTQIDSKIGLTFSSALRSLLRQDPNILMVGEIRDGETASLAINAALTGHLVLSTLHTNSAPGAIPRLIDMKVEPFLLSSTLNFILAQRLVRKLSDDKEKYSLGKEQIQNISKYCNIEKIMQSLVREGVAKKGDKLEDIYFYKPKDMVSGYKGRLGIYELLVVSENIRNIISRGANASEILKQAEQEGFEAMVQDGFVKAAMGQTSIEEVLRVINE